MLACQHTATSTRGVLRGAGGRQQLAGRTLCRPCRATDGKAEPRQEEPPAAAPSTAPPSSPTSGLTPAQQAEANKPLILQQGQGTAIVTGGISIIFGVAYLALVLLMVRGRGGAGTQHGGAGGRTTRMHHAHTRAATTPPHLRAYMQDWRGGEMLPPPPEAYGP